MLRHVLAALLLAALATAPLIPGAVPDASAQTAKDVKVTVLSTMLVGNTAAGIGEWGFAAVLEVDGRRLLVDTGARAETVLQNAGELKIDLSTITDLVITHNHADHTGGLLVLRRELARKNPAALSRVHVPKGIFYPRPGPGGREGNGLLPLKAQVQNHRRHVRRARGSDSGDARRHDARAGAARASRAQLEQSTWRRDRTGADT